MRSFIVILLLVSVLGVKAQTSEKQLRDSLSFVKDDKTKFDLLVKLAGKIAVHSSDSAMKLAMNAFFIARRSENEKDLSRVYRLFSQIYFNDGKYSLAVENYKTAFNHSQKINDSSAMSSLLNDIARAYLRIGEPKLALEFLHSALDMASAKKDNEMIGIVNNNMALALVDTGEDSLALKYYQKSLDIAEEAKDTSSIILSLNNIGFQYYRMKRLKKEEECFLKALVLTEKTKDVKMYGITYDNIGSMWEERGNYQKAFVYYQKELEYERKSGVKVYVAEALKSLSSVCIKMKNYQMALNYAMECYKLSEQIQSAELKVAAARNLSIAFEKVRQFEESLQYLKIATVINDSLTSVEKARTVSNLASRYELTKKETEIKSLNFEKEAQKTELQHETKIKYGLIIFLCVVTLLLVIAFYQYRARKKANDMLLVWSRAVDQKNQQLDNLNKVKDKIFSSIAHDVRSPLASLQGLIGLLNQNILSQEEFQKITIELSARVNTTSALLENLLNWSKNQIATAKANPVRTDVKNLVAECMGLYANNARGKNISFVNKIKEEIFIYADEEMVRIILRNLISNAIKFTRNHGEVCIDTSHLDNMLCVAVSDSGVGIPEEDISKIFSLEAYTTPGTAKEKGTGLGLILCKEFVEKNGGEIRVNSSHGKGSTFSFTIPQA